MAMAADMFGTLGADVSSTVLLRRESKDLAKIERRVRWRGGRRRDYRLGRRFAHVATKSLVVHSERTTTTQATTHAPYGATARWKRHGNDMRYS